MLHLKISWKTLAFVNIMLSLFVLSTQSYIKKLESKMRLESTYIEKFLNSTDFAYYQVMANSVLDAVRSLSDNESVKNAIYEKIIGISTFRTQVASRISPAALLLLNDSTYGNIDFEFEAKEINSTLDNNKLIPILEKHNKRNEYVLGRLLQENQNDMLKIDIAEYLVYVWSCLILVVNALSISSKHAVSA